MGRVKHYSTQNNKKKHRQDKHKIVEDSENTQNLSIAKKKQIFKKSKAKVVKAKITELKQRSLKLKKKNLDQKAEKKKIAKEIHRLKASLKASSEVVEKDDE